MQFTIATFVAIFAASAIATPVESVVARDTNQLNALQSQASAFVAAKEASGCHKLKCLAALAPMAASCAAALAEVGLNPLADAACLANLANNSFNRPTGCDNC